MIKKSVFLSKTPVIGVIILFIGAGIQPALAELPTEFDDSELVKYTVQVGDSEHTVVLSSGQAEELENLIDTTKTRLNMATTIEETEQIFDETVVSLYDFGLLPDGMSVDDAQKVVKGVNRFNHMYKVFGGLSRGNLGIFDNETNLFCLIAGETYETVFLSLLFFLERLYYNYIAPLGTVLLFILNKIYDIFPFYFGNTASLGKLHVHNTIIPASGWITTQGLLGHKEWDGEFYGGITSIWNFIFHYCVGIRGFTGLRIQNNSNDFYLGWALQVKIRNYIP